MALKACTIAGYCFADSVAAALRYAGDQQLDVVNLSLFADPYLYYCADEAGQRVILKELQGAALYAQQGGVVIVASAGNEADDLGHPATDNTSPDWPPGSAIEREVRNNCRVAPAELPGVITVSATGVNTLASYSNVGNPVDVAAPGGDAPQTPSTVFGRGRILAGWSSTDATGTWEALVAANRAVVSGGGRYVWISGQERLLFWFHDCCIPDWLRDMKYDDPLKYAEKLTYDTMKHFGDKLYAMEVVNELHDWANELQLNHEQITELTRLINDVAKSVAPNVKRTINNCCPFAEYVQLNSYSKKKAVFPQRSVYKFSKDLIEAGIDFDILEQQMYFPYRDLQDSILLLEKLATLGKPMQLSEVGVPGGPSNYSVKNNTVPISREPYLWRLWRRRRFTFQSITLRSGGCITTVQASATFPTARTTTSFSSITLLSSVSCSASRCQEG